MARTQKESIQIDVEILGSGAKKELAEITQRKKQLTKELGKLTEGTKEYERVSKDLSQVNRRYEQLRPTLKNLTNRKKALRRELRNLEIGTDAYIKKSQELADVETKLRKLNKQARGLNDEVQKSPGLFGKIGGAAKGAAAAMGAIFAVQQVLAYTVKLKDAILETEKLRNQTAQLTGQSGTQLDQTTAKVKALAQVYGKDYNEVLQATNAFSQQMGISFDDAFGKIQQGFQQGADINGDFLDKVKEYPVQFKNAGFNAEQFVQLATQEVRGGVFSDKLLDTVKEMNLSLTEMTKSQQDALKNAFGTQFTDQLVQDLNTGAITTAEAYTRIRDEAEKTGLSKQQFGQITADIMKGAGEDVGGYTEVMKQMDAAMDININSLDTYGVRQKALTDATTEAELALVGLTREFDGAGNSANVLGQQALAFLYRMLTAVVQNMDVLIDSGSNLVRKFLDIGRQIGLVSEDADTMGMAIDFVTGSIKIAFTPINLLIQGLSWLADEFRSAYEEGGTFKTVVDSVVGFVQDLGDWIQRAAGWLMELSGQEEAYEQKRKLRAQQRAQEEKDRKAREEEDEKKRQEEREQREKDAYNRRLAAERQFQQQRKEAQSTDNPDSSATPGEDPQADLAELEYESLSAKYSARLQATQEGEISLQEVKDEVARIDEEMGNSRLAREAAEMEARQEIRNAYYDSLNQGIDVLRSIFGEESKIGKALLIAQKAMAIGQIWQNTAVANAKATALMPVTGGQPWVTINTIMAGVQTGKVVAETAKALGAFAGGGFTGTSWLPTDDTGHRPAGIVHENEYVSPTWIIRKYPETFAALERVRLRGFAMGGFTSTTPSVPMDAPTTGAAQQEESNGLAQMTMETLAMLNQTLSRGIRANVNPDEISDYEAEKNYIQDRVTI